MKIIAIVHPKILKDMKHLGWNTKGFIASQKLKVKKNGRQA